MREFEKRLQEAWNDAVARGLNPGEARNDVMERIGEVLAKALADSRSHPEASYTEAEVEAAKRVSDAAMSILNSKPGDPVAQARALETAELFLLMAGRLSRQRIETWESTGSGEEFRLYREFRDALAARRQNFGPMVDEHRDRWKDTQKRMFALRDRFPDFRPQSNPELKRELQAIERETLEAMDRRTKEIEAEEAEAERLLLAALSASSGNAAQACRTAMNDAQASLSRWLSLRPARKKPTLFDF